MPPSAEYGGYNMVVMRAEGPGAQIAARRIALGMSKTVLAKEARVDEGALTDAEEDRATVRASTFGILEATLDKLEHEMGMDLPGGTRLVGNPGEGLVEIIVEGVHGVGRIVVKGPAGNLAEMQKAVVALIRDSKAAQADESGWVYSPERVSTRTSTN
jgi:hypothetical protein